MKTTCERYRTKLVWIDYCNSFARRSFLTLVCRLALVFLLFLWVLWVFSPAPALAQENPYFVAYDHYLEEPGNLEIEYFSTFGTQRAANDFHASWGEFEYGATACSPTHFYLDPQTTFNPTPL